MAEIEIRPARPGDAAEVGDVWLRSFTTALPGVRLAHTSEEVRAWLRDVLLPRGGTWVAVAEQRVVGMLAVHGHDLDQLYVDPDWHGRGIGSRFVGLAKERSASGLTLWTFQVNAPARRFYERHGFVPVEYTDGAANEEREPDVRYVWPAPEAPETSAS
ncbi:MAG TPA: GNAT family N-acetyltransferase [Micromonosporaceae bacterium]|nr:GNAT family N-acetyltransferase [Micromonosporaceae bacterium]